ncbi:MAG: alkyl sulfatase dimerization domain-containing protein [Candidatus Binatia bacterium]
MADLLALSARYIDEGIYEGPGSVNRVTTELSEISDGVAVIEAFSHVVTFRTGDGLVLFDTSLGALAGGVKNSLRAWSGEPVNTIAFTHGHIDHVGGAGTFIKEAEACGNPRPRFVGHENVAARIERYEMTNGYNALINERQFGGGGDGSNLMGNTRGSGELRISRFGPKEWVYPDTTFREHLAVRVGDTVFELNHSKGETDDHLWAWVPEREAICAGDFLIWCFPNAGNPQKVQRYPLEWARTLRQMEMKEPELLLPAHGLPIGGRRRVRAVLFDTATALETILEQSLKLMNQGARLDALIHEVKVPDYLLDKPYLRPTYDEPEFIVHNIWRLYGGWYDGNPANLKPAAEAALAREMVSLAGGVEKLIDRARDLAGTGDTRLACHLIEMATSAEPGHKEAHGARAEIYGLRRKEELSLMSKGIYGYAERESLRLAERKTP